MSGLPSSGVTNPHPLDTLNHLHLPLRRNPVDDGTVTEDPQQLFSADRSRSGTRVGTGNTSFHQNKTERNVKMDTILSSYSRQTFHYAWWKSLAIEWCGTAALDDVDIVHVQTNDGLRCAYHPVDC